MRNTVFISEDLPGVGLSGGIRGGLYRAYAALLDLAVARVIKSGIATRSVVSSRFLERNPDLAAISQLVSFNYVTSKSLAKADVAPLIAFHKKLLELFPASEAGASAAAAEAVSNRVILAGSLELLARPSEAMAAFLDSTGGDELVLLSGSSAQEQIAESVAKARGWKIRRSAFAFLFSAIAGLRRIILHDRDGLPSVREIGAGYRAGSHAPAHADIFFFCIDERRIRRLTETMRRLVTSGSRVRLGALNVKKEVRESLKAFEGTDVQCDVINHFLPTDPDLDQLDNLLNAAKRVWSRLLQEPELRSAGSYSGTEIATFCADKLLLPAAKFTVEAALFEAAARRYLDLRRPKLVVLADNGLHSMVMARICGQLGIPTVYYVYNPMLFTVAYWPKLLFESMKTKYVLTATEHMAAIYRSDGNYSSDAVRTVGDVFAKPAGGGERQLARDALSSRIGAAAEDKVVVALSFFVSADLSEQQKRVFLRTVGEAVKRIGRTKLVIKAHPNEDAALLQKMLDEEAIPHSLLSKHDDLRTLLLGCDAACMVFSQAGMEIVMLDLPLFIVQDADLLPGFEDWVPYVREGAARSASSSQELAEKLAPVLFDDSQRSAMLASASRFRSKYITPDGANPVERMVAELLRLAATP